MKTADAVKEILEKPYKLGNFKDGYDCFSMFLSFCDMKGIEIPCEWFSSANPPECGQGWTRENYAERWERGEGRAEMYEFLHNLGTEVDDVNYMRENDIILLAVDMGGDVIFTMPSIYLGNGHILLVTIETGAIVIPLWAVKEKIYEVRRLG